MRYFLFIAALILAFSTLAAAGAKNGIANLKSAHDVKTTVERLEKAINKRGMHVVAKIDHTQAAADAGMKLRPTVLVLFAHPKLDTQLMLCSQTTALDLPQKMLIQQDKNGEVWVSYNIAQYLNERHGLDACVPLLKQNTMTLHILAMAATMR